MGRRFSLVKMEHDAVCETHEELRADVDVAVRQLVMERAVLRGAVADLLARLEQSRHDRETDREAMRSRERHSQRLRSGVSAAPSAEESTGAEPLRLVGQERGEDEEGSDDGALAKRKAQIGRVAASDAVLLQAQLELQAIEDAQDDDDLSLEAEEGVGGESEGDEGEEMVGSADGVLQRGSGEQRDTKSAQVERVAAGAPRDVGRDGRHAASPGEYEPDYEDDEEVDIGGSDEQEMQDGEAAQSNQGSPEEGDQVGTGVPLEDDVFAPARDAGHSKLGAQRRLFVSQIDDGCLYEGEGIFWVPPGAVRCAAAARADQRRWELADQRVLQIFQAWRRRRMVTGRRPIPTARRMKASLRMASGAVWVSTTSPMGAFMRANGLAAFERGEGWRDMRISGLPRRRCRR